MNGAAARPETVRHGFAVSDESQSADGTVLLLRDHLRADAEVLEVLLDERQSFHSKCERVDFSRERRIGEG